MTRISTADIRKGMKVCDVGGRQLGEVEDVLEPGRGLVAAVGGPHLRVASSEPGRRRVYDFPMASVISVAGDTITVETQRDTNPPHDHMHIQT